MLSFFFFNDTATTEIYTLSLHDALPISAVVCARYHRAQAVAIAWEVIHQIELCSIRAGTPVDLRLDKLLPQRLARSEEHTSELQSQSNLVCRLLLEKKNERHML